MNGKISIHNSAAEMAETPELIRTLQIQQLAFEADGHTLPYCQRITCGNSPRENLFLQFFCTASALSGTIIFFRSASPPLRWSGTVKTAESKRFCFFLNASRDING